MGIIACAKELAGTGGSC